MAAEATPQQASILSAGRPQGLLRFAVAAVNSPEEALDAYERLADYLGRILDKEVEVVRGKTYGEINDLLRSGDVDMALVCSLPYVEGRDAFGLEALVAPEMRGGLTYRSYLITHKDSPYDSWEQLKGRTFAFTDPMSNTGRLVPVYTLWEMGETPDSFFSKYIFTYSHANSIKAVADRLVDAASVDSQVYEYLVVKSATYVGNTKVIWRSETFGMQPIVVHPRMDPALKALIAKILLEMDESEEGRAVLRDLNYNRFVEADDAAYDGIRAMRRRMESKP